MHIGREYRGNCRRPHSSLEGSGRALCIGSIMEGQTTVSLLRIPDDTPTLTLATTLFVRPTEQTRCVQDVKS